MELGLISCKDESPNPGFFAGVAAKGYYDLLLEGKYEAYVAGFNQPNRLPDSYHKQLVLNAQMFVEQQNEERKGIKSVEVLNAKSDTTLHIADVFLQVAYGDKTKERFKEEDDRIRINAVIYVERDSQKGIIIGHQGVALKKVNMESRKSLEKFFNKKIFLETFVKVDKDWRSSQKELDAFGYNPE
jgi:hypothetical protein